MFTKIIRRFNIVNLVKKYKTEDMSDIENEDLPHFAIKQKQNSLVILYNPARICV